MFLYEFNNLIYSHGRYHTEYYPLKRKHENHLFNKRLKKNGSLSIIKNSKSLFTASSYSLIPVPPL